MTALRLPAPRRRDPLDVTNGSRRRRTSGAVGKQPVPSEARIFVTVGTELPFDRLIAAVDDWAGATGRGRDVFAQIGHTSYVPRHIAWAPMIEGREFRQLFDRADLIVAHAGMGTILAALELERPLVVVPRRADLGEHRNDHQLATVARLAERGLINGANDERDVIPDLDGRADIRVAQRIDDVAPAMLIDGIRRAIRGA